ncbi:MAG: hypothetical protein AABX30_03550 [Nanoarchaeota archaeon]
MNKINKKGILLDESLKIFLAIIVLVMLLYLFYSLYNIIRVKTEIEQARATLDSIIDKANILGDGETTGIIIESPKDWMIASFYGNEYGNEPLPYTCENSNCLCICKQNKIEKNLISLNSDKKTLCSNDAVCKKLLKDIEVNNLAYGVIRLDELPLTVKLRENNGFVEIGDSQQIDFGTESDKYLQEILSYVITLNSKPVSIKDALFYYINGNPSSLTDIQSAIKFFLNEKDIDGNFYIWDGDYSDVIASGKGYVPIIQEKTGLDRISHAPSKFGVIETDNQNYKIQKINIGYTFFKK